MESNKILKENKVYKCKCGYNLSDNLYCDKCKRVYILDNKKLRELILSKN